MVAELHGEWRIEVAGVVGNVLRKNHLLNSRAAVNAPDFPGEHSARETHYDIVGALAIVQAEWL